MNHNHDKPRSPRQQIWGLRVVWLLYACVLFYFTHTPVPEGLAGVTSSYDKLLHFGAYFVLAILTGLVFLSRHSPRRSYFAVIASLLLFAAVDEILQGPVGRQTDFVDWVCDGIGIVTGLLALGFALKWQSAFSQHITHLLRVERQPDPIDSTVK